MEWQCLHYIYTVVYVFVGLHINYFRNLFVMNAAGQQPMLIVH